MKLAGLTLLRGFSRTVLGIMAGWPWSLALDAPWVLELYVMLTVLPKNSGADNRQALPLMNIIFGDITKDFSEYFVAGSGVTESEFKAAVNKNSYVRTICSRHHSN